MTRLRTGGLGSDSAQTAKLKYRHELETGWGTIGEGSLQADAAANERHTGKVRRGSTKAGVDV